MATPWRASNRTRAREYFAHTNIAFLCPPLPLFAKGVTHETANNTPKKVEAVADLTVTIQFVPASWLSNPPPEYNSDALTVMFWCCWSSDQHEQLVRVACLCFFRKQQPETNLKEFPCGTFHVIFKCNNEYYNVWAYVRFYENRNLEYG